MGLFGREDQQYELRARSYGQWLRRQNPLAVASLVLGIFSLIEMGVLLIFGIGGIALGIVGLLQIRRALQLQTGQIEGFALAWGGIVTSAISLILAVMLYLRFFG